MIIALTTKRFLKAQFFSSGAPRPLKNCIRPFFRLMEYDKPQGAIYKSSKAILTNTVEVIGSIL